MKGQSGSLNKCSMDTRSNKPAMLRLFAYLGKRYLLTPLHELRGILIKIHRYFKVDPGV